MKEASGELSMTAVAIVAIAAVGVIFTTLIWPAIKNNLKHNTQCANAVNCTSVGDGKSSCQYLDGDVYITITCPDSTVK